jgi:Uma2 family endonuclease
MSAQSAEHSWIIEQLSEIVYPQAAGRVTVKVQSPLALSDIDEPEPDLALVPRGDYKHGHPTEALLVVEVSVSTRTVDLRSKAVIYALAEVPELWVVDAKGGCVHVHTEPVLGVWTKIRRAERGEILVPQLAPFVSVAVSDILPD